jgi:hypothetical protein
MVYIVLHLTGVLVGWFLASHPCTLCVTSDCSVGFTATYLGQERKYQQNDCCIPKSVLLFCVLVSSKGRKFISAAFCWYYLVLY